MLYIIYVFIGTRLGRFFLWSTKQVSKLNRIVPAAIVVFRKWNMTFGRVYAYYTHIPSLLYYYYVGTRSKIIKTEWFIRHCNNKHRSYNNIIRTLYNPYVLNCTQLALEHTIQMALRWPLKKLHDVKFIFIFPTDVLNNLVLFAKDLNNIFDIFCYGVYNLRVLNEYLKRLIYQ